LIDAIALTMGNERPVILLAGLDEISVDACARVAVTKGCVFLEARTLEAALTTVTTQAPWIVVLPPVLGGLSLPELCEQFRAAADGKQVALIAIVPTDAAETPIEPPLCLCVPARAGAATLCAAVAGMLPILADLRRHYST
jgi:hypothetical protein